MSKKQENKKLNNLNPYEGRVGLVYARVSSKRQETDGSGLQSQEGRCMDFLKRNSVDYQKSFLDSYSGGGDFMNRPAMKELLAYIDKNIHKKYVVVFDDLARFARDVVFHIKLRAEFKQRNVVLKCLNYDFDESDLGQFVELIFAGKVELDRKQNRTQVIQKQKARLELGYWPFGPKKGYDMIKYPDHGKLLVPNKEGLEVLKPALEKFARGEFVRKIDMCKFLVEKGFWKNQYPSAYIDKLTYILKDPAHVGDIQYLPWEVSRRKGHHQGIISEEIFNLIQQRLGNKGVTKRIRVDVREDFPLRGLLICSSCGHYLTGAITRAKGKPFPYYFCQNGLCEFGKKSVRKKVVEDGFDELLQKIKLKPEVGKLVEAVFEKVWKEELAQIEAEESLVTREKTELEDKVKKLTDMICDAKNEKLRSIYEKQLEEVGSELDTLAERASIKEIDMKVPYRNALKKAIGLIKSPYVIWKKLDVIEKHRLFYFIFDEKLLYSKKEGYRNDNLPCAVRLFEQFATQNPHDVEVPALKPDAKKELKSFYNT